VTSTLAGLLDVFDVTRVRSGEYQGSSDAGDRDLIDASQLLAQSIVAASDHASSKVVRKASGVFCRPVRAAEPIDFQVQEVHSGRIFTTLVIAASQRERTCATLTVLLDVPTADVVRHPPRPSEITPDAAIPHDMPLLGREVRLVDLADPNDPDEVGPPWIEAWLSYEPVPDRDDLRRALLAHFAGHLSISTTLRAHPGVGTAMSHRTLSTAVMTIDVSFHDPIEWSGWLHYDHESTAVGAGMSYVRGQVRDQPGRLIASFNQGGMIRAFDDGSAGQGLSERARL
jgi:acyl-CoA thioesterase-2